MVKVTVKVFVTGASGNVGSTIVRTIPTKKGFELVGGWCRRTGSDIGTLAGTAPLGMKVAATLGEGLSSSKPDVVIDFSSAAVMEENMKIYLDAGLNAVIGTTGFTDEQFEPFRREVGRRGLRWAAIANYGLGVSLVSDFVKSVGRYYPYVSITDRHPETMANAPSGTAAGLARAASEAPLGKTASREVYPGVLGGLIHGVQVFSQRMPWPGPYSEHEITLARKDEIVKIVVEDHTSDIYMDGVFLTAEKIGGLPPGTFVENLSEIMNA
jgi:4-hydroxy-tetrahydrodipicolinate reductase